jgi:plastocyanin
MRFRHIAAAFIALSATLGLCPKATHAHDYPLYSTYYYSTPVVYYQAYVPAYSSSSMYSAPASYQQPYSSQSSYGSGSQSSYGSTPAYTTSYYSARMVHYQPCLPAHSSRMYSAPPNYQQPYGGQPSYAPGRSPMRPTTTISVGAYDNRFEPQTINVQPGTTVRWVNYGRHNHTVTSNDERWDSGDIRPGASYSATFVHPGTYYYYCRHHTQDKMQGTIVVGGAPASGGYGGSRSPGY